MGRLLPPQTVVWRGAVSGLRVSSVDGAAFVDNLPSAVTDLVTADPGVYLAEIYDVSSRALKGVLSSVGSGETLGDELVVNGDFSAWTGDNPDGWTTNYTEDANNYVTEVSGAARIVANGVKPYFAIQQITTASPGALYKKNS